VRALDGSAEEGPHDAVDARISAPAKLTLSLRITGVRADGYHLLDAEMVSISLADELEFSAGTGLRVVDEVPGALGVARVPTGADNLVARALRVVGKQAAVRVRKRIPTGAGLGGGSADAGAVLRWAGVRNAELAARLGADVPFCVVGGHARVGGIGELVDPLPAVERSFLILLPPLSIETAAVYRAWDEGQARRVPGAPVDQEADAGNDLEPAALAVEPALAKWRTCLGDATGRRPRLAGSGSAWFVEGTPAEVGLEGRPWLSVGSVRAPLVAVRTVPACGDLLTGP
jgi:4-diphosphocytidyl-2-C-methyl-D-erythritol kinase